MKRLFKKSKEQTKEVDTSKVKSTTVVATEKVNIAENPGEYQTKQVEVQVPANLTFVREGLSGEYIFAEIPGSIAARSLSEAIEKAQEIMAKHPALVR